jgi:hypothetical protein
MIIFGLIAMAVAVMSPLWHSGPASTYFPSSQMALGALTRFAACR